jgi:hypothetical protein
MKVLDQAGQNLLQARVWRGSQAGDDGLGDGVLVEVSHGLSPVVGALCLSSVNIDCSQWNKSLEKKISFPLTEKPITSTPWIAGPKLNCLCRWPKPAA